MIEEMINKKSGEVFIELYARDNNCTAGWYHVGDQLHLDHYIQGIYLDKQEIPGEFIS